MSHGQLLLYLFRLPVMERAATPLPAMSPVKPALDHLRWIAAFAVVFQHARSLILVDYSPGVGLLAKALYFVTGFSHEAVIIFFVLSGYLVGGKAIRLAQGSTEDQRARFVVDRFVRIFIVLLPALAITALVALLAPPVPVIASDNWGADIPNAVATSTAAAWLGTTFLVNEIVTRTTPYDGALWSLAYEWTYYVLAAAALFIAALDRRPLAVLLYLYAAALLLLCALLAPLVLAMGLFWIAGALASQLRRVDHPYLTVAAFLAILLATRFDLVGPFVEDALVAASTALLIADRSVQRLTLWQRPGVYLASFSYSLYAIHWPLMLGAVAAVQASGLLPQRLPPGMVAYASIAALIILAYAASMLFASFTEQQTGRLKNLIIKSRSSSISPNPRGAAVTPPPP